MPDNRLIRTAAGPSALQCEASAPWPLVAAMSGTAELVGVYLLTFSGGTGPITTDVQVLVNTAVASPTQAQLLVDDGSAGSFAGAITKRNVITFRDVTFTSPGNSGQRILRITHLRVNAAMIGARSTATLRQIVLYVKLLNSNITIKNAQRMVAVIEPSRGEHQALRSARPGPSRDIDTAKRVAAIVERVAAGRPWQPMLEEICEILDDDKISCPKTWCKRDPAILNWTDASITAVPLAKKAIAHHLSNAKI